MAHQTVGVRVPARDLAILGAIVFLLAFFGFAIVQFGGALKASQVPQPTSAERLPGPVVQLEPFTVSLIGAETTTLLRVKLVLELDDWKTVAEIKRHLAPVQLITSSHE